MISRRGVGLRRENSNMSGSSSTRRAATRAARARQRETGESYAEARRHAAGENDQDRVTRQQQLPAYSSVVGGHFTLVPPETKEFGVYGTDEVVDRAAVGSRSPAAALQRPC